MIEEELNKQLFNKIPKNGKVAIFGAGAIGSAMMKDIQMRRPDVKIICFLDNKKTGLFWNLPVYALKEFIDKKIKVDIVIISSYSAQFSKVHFANINNILNVYDIPFVPMSNLLLNKYDGRNLIINDETYKKCMNIFEKQEDKDLFALIFKVFAGIESEFVLHEYYKNTYSDIYPVANTIKYHYLDRINKEKIKTVFDIGFNTGFEALAYKKLIPKYVESWAFEPIYEMCRDEIIDEFVIDDTIKIVKCAVGDKKGKAKFFINKNEKGSSFIDFSKDIDIIYENISQDLREITVDVITLDDFCKENNVYPDFIKMDIEGAELHALKGGIESIKKSRPQLAISIYHSCEDFVNIPLYLYKNLENYVFRIGHYCPARFETVFYAIPKELCN